MLFHSYSHILCIFNDRYLTYYQSNIKDYMKPVLPHTAVISNVDRNRPVAPIL